MNELKTLFSNSSSFVVFIGICLGTIFLAFVIRRYLEKLLQRKTIEQNSKITSFRFIKHFITATIYLVGFGWALLSLPISQSYATTLFAGAGASTLIVGFASQQLLSNVMSGIYLVLKRQFKINDIIEVAGNRGRVVELNLHDTIIEDEEKNLVIIPNTMISNGVIKNIKKKD
jgi:small conductance mechanosensitive channel